MLGKWRVARVLPIGLGGVLALAGCSATRPALASFDHAAMPRCSLVMAATLPLLPDAEGKPVVAILAAGRLLRMQVDSGAETSVLTTASATRLGLVPSAARTVQGAGGVARYPTARLTAVDFGGQTIPTLTVPVMALRGGEAVDGLIGADLLAPFQVGFDPARAAITLYRAYHCRTPHPPWPATALDWTGPWQIPVIGAVLDGHGIAAVLDTGSASSFVDARLAPVAAAVLRADPRRRAYAAGGMAVEGSLHRFGALRLGAVSLSTPRLRVVARMPAPGIGMVIGMDLLGDRALWLDYAGRRAYLGSATP